MLGKLMKYEWKATWKLLVPANGFLILMTILVYATIRMSFFRSPNMVVTMIEILIIMTYILSMLAVVIMTMIYLTYRFYKSVYGDEGYLLHTLPVDKHQIIVAKAAVSTLWVFCSILLIYFSIFFLASANQFLLRSMVDSIESYLELVGDSTGVSGFVILMSLITLFVTIIARVLKITACISLGQLSPNHKVLSALGIYCGFYFLQRMFNLIYYMILILVVESSVTEKQDYVAAWGTSWETALISGLIYSVVFYFLTWYIMDKKLNLE